MRGTLFITKIANAPKVEDQDGLKVFGVRIAKFLPEGWVNWDQTAPSRKLLYKAKDLEKVNRWNEKSFKSDYAPFYLEEMKGNPKAKEEFTMMKNELDKGNDVYYACYCNQSKLCHRSIVGSFFSKKGYSVREIN